VGAVAWTGDTFGGTIEDQECAGLIPAPLRVLDDCLIEVRSV
jgi:hypothetical protein